MPRIAAKQRTLLLKDITAVVQCKPKSGRVRLWQTMAAFNVVVAAESYACEAVRQNDKHFEYQVIDLEGK